MTNFPAPHEFNDIYLLARRSRIPGHLSLDPNQLSWSAKRNHDRIVKIAAADITNLKWHRADEHFQLSIEAREEDPVSLHGFKEKDLEILTKFADSNGLKLSDVKLATRGWNWGDCAVEDGQIAFQVEGQALFEIPLTDISQAARQGKNEVSIEFHQDDTAPPDEDCLVEMRLYVPPLGVDEADEDEATRQEMAVSQFHETIREKIVSTGLQDESIATFSQVLFISPRGRYEVEMFASYLTLHGKTFTYKILYKSISQLFMLENPDKVVFVIGLEPAIRQGGTMYPYLLLAFDPEDEIELRPNLSPDVIRDKYHGKLAVDMEGPVHEVIGRVFRALVNRKVVVPGSFRSAEGNKCVQCSLKANDGFLHPLEKCFFFVNKPVTYLRYDDITSAEFARVDAKSKTFDLIITRRQPGTVIFTQISRDEYSPLLEFLKSKNIHIANMANEEIEEDAVEARVSSSGRRIRPNKDADEEPAEEMDESEDDESFKAESEDEVSDEYSSRSRASDDEGGDIENSDEDAIGDEEEEPEMDSEEDQGDDGDDDEDEQDEDPTKSKKKSAPSRSEKSAKKRKQDSGSDSE